MSTELGLTGRVECFSRSGQVKVIIFGNVPGGHCAGSSRRGIVHVAGMKSDRPAVLNQMAAHAREALLTLGISEEPEE